MSNFIYPESEENPYLHKEIVTALLRGTFISDTGTEYEAIRVNKEWYTSFFLNSFGAILKHEYEIYYLVNEDSRSIFAEKILTIIAILMYEMNNKGIDPVKALREGVFAVDIINKYLEESIQFSSFYDKNAVTQTFVNRMEALRLIRKLDDERFVFTGAIEMFISEFDNIRAEVASMEKEDNIVY